MLVEPGVLYCHKSILQILGDLRQFDGNPIFCSVDIGDLIAVHVVDLGRGRRLKVVH